MNIDIALASLRISLKSSRDTVEVNRESLKAVLEAYETLEDERDSYQNNWAAADEELELLKREAFRYA